MRVKMLGIYRIKNLVDNKVYIGQSVHIEQRLSGHKACLRHNKHENSYLQNAWNKYGEDKFEFTILEECLKDELDAKEIYWINNYKSYIREYGYNIETGGSNDKKIYNPVLRFDLSGNFLDEWINGYEASNQLSIAVGTIYGCLTKKYKNAGKYIFVYKSEYEKTKDISYWLTNMSYKPVYQYDLYGSLIKIHNTKKEAENLMHGSISSSLYNKTYTSLGYIWKFKEDISMITEDYCYMARNSLHLICNRPFYKVDMFGNKIKYYLCQREAVEDGYCERLVSECLRGLRNKHKGYLWIYEEEVDKYSPDLCFKKFNTPEKKISGKVYKLDLITEEILKEYNCLEDTKLDGYLPTNIGECCKGRVPQYKGYKWKCETII